jgi:outer membrane lipoprotein SlyB
MRRIIHPTTALAAALVLAGGLAACAPQNTGSTYTAAGMGRAASVSYGTVIGMRQVNVQGSQGGIGALGGAAAGGVAGSFIGGDTRSNILAGLGGALIGGLAGGAAERGLSSGVATEFTVREDGGGDIAVVQTNEQALQVGDRVVVARGERTRLSRAAGSPGPAPYGTLPR